MPFLSCVLRSGLLVDSILQDHTDLDFQMTANISQGSTCWWCTSVQGLLNLAEVAGILNDTEKESQYASDAADLLNAMHAQMWNESAGMYCDGICRADTVS